MASVFEHRSTPLLPRSALYRRIFRSLILSLGLLVVSLSIGMLGYHGLEHLSWLDSFVSAAMILSGMGPVLPLQTAAGKFFAGCYALFSGLMFITVAG